MSHPAHILIAEGSDAVRAMLARAIALSYPRATLSMTADGVRALEIYRRRGADLLVTSSHLPLLDGPDLIRALRAQHASLPILLLSSDPTMLQVAEQIGANRFVLKPFTLQELRQALGALVAP